MHRTKGRGTHERQGSDCPVSDDGRDDETGGAGATGGGPIAMPPPSKAGAGPNSSKGCIPSGSAPPAIPANAGGKADLAAAVSSPTATCDAPPVTCSVVTPFIDGVMASVAASSSLIGTGGTGCAAGVMLMVSEVAMCSFAAVSGWPLAAPDPHRARAGRLLRTVVVQSEAGRGAADSPPNLVEPSAPANVWASK